MKLYNNDEFELDSLMFRYPAQRYMKLFWMFFKTAKGVKSSALLHSITETAKVNGLEFGETLGEISLTLPSDGIIDVETYNTVQTILNENKAVRSSKSNKIAFTGALRCGECG